MILAKNLNVATLNINIHINKVYMNNYRLIEQCHGLLSTIAAEKAPIELGENPRETSVLSRVVLGVTFKNQQHSHVKVRSYNTIYSNEPTLIPNL